MKVMHIFLAIVISLSLVSFAYSQSVETIDGVNISGVSFQCGDNDGICPSDFDPLKRPCVVYDPDCDNSVHEDFDYDTFIDGVGFCDINFQCGGESDGICPSDFDPLNRICYTIDPDCTECLVFNGSVLYTGTYSYGDDIDLNARIHGNSCDGNNLTFVMKDDSGFCQFNITSDSLSFNSNLITAFTSLTEVPIPCDNKTVTAEDYPVFLNFDDYYLSGEAFGGFHFPVDYSGGSGDPDPGDPGDPGDPDPIYYYVVFNTNGGLPFIETQPVLAGETATQPGNPTSPGRTFMGWYLNEDFSDSAYDFNNPVNSNMTLHAKWDLVDANDFFYVTFNTMGGSYVQEQQLPRGQKAVRPDNPNKEGYTFDNWYTTIDLDVVYDFNTPVNDNITLYANWNEGPSPPPTSVYLVLFESNGGSPVPSQNVIENGFVVEPTNPVRTGHTFDGWYLNEDFSGSSYVFNTPVNDNITLYAKWNENDPNPPSYYTIIFNTQGGFPSIDSQQIIDGGKVEKPDDPNKDGFNFGGWYTNTNFENKYIFDNPVYSSFTLYANWTTTDGDDDDDEGVIYEVNFESNGGSPVPSQFIYENETVYEPSNPSKKGYIFDRWVTFDGSAYNFNTLVTSNFTLYAVWDFDVSNRFEVNFNSNGGSPVQTQYIDEGYTATRPENPTRSGFNFDNWYIEPDFINIYNFYTPVTSNMTLHAKWNTIGGPDPEPDDLCYVVLQGYSKLGNDAPINNVNVRLNKKNSDLIFETFTDIYLDRYYIYFDNRGSLTINDIEGDYELMFSKIGYSPVIQDLTLMCNDQEQINATMYTTQSLCQPDCTMLGSQICDRRCHGFNGCYYPSDSIKNVCDPTDAPYDGALTGHIKQVEGENIRCCTGLTTQQLDTSEIKVPEESRNVVKTTRIVFLNGQPVRLNVVVYN